MNQITLTILALLILWSQAESGLAQNAPTSIAGIALGSSIKDYPEITDTNFLTEVVVTDWHGFRKGVISYGICHHKDTILKIDMKYADKSRSFYKKLLKKFRKKYGEPDIWNGDSFGVKYIWKWHFLDQEDNRISITLQHNSKDANETIGNMVKLSYPEKLAKERACFNKQCKDSRMALDAKRQEELKKSNWSHLVPQ